MHGTVYVRTLPRAPKRLDVSPAAAVVNGREKAQRVLREQAHLDAKCLARAVVTEQPVLCTVQNRGRVEMEG